MVLSLHQQRLLEPSLMQGSHGCQVSRLLFNPSESPLEHCLLSPLLWLGDGLGVSPKGSWLQAWSPVCKWNLSEAEPGARSLGHEITSLMEFSWRELVLVRAGCYRASRLCAWPLLHMAVSFSAPPLSCDATRKP